MDVPLLVAVSTFLAILLASSAAFLYMNSREALQAWRRRAEGSPLANEPANGGAVDHMRAQFQALLEWFAKLNQPANVEEARATRRRLITAGYRSAKAPVVFAGVKLFLAVLMTALTAERIRRIGLHLAGDSLLSALPLAVPAEPVRMRDVQLDRSAVASVPGRPMNDPPCFLAGAATSDSGRKVSARSELVVFPDQPNMRVRDTAKVRVKRAYA